MRCLEKAPERRYRSANALLRDLERQENDEPVDAGPPELSYRLRKFVRRNKAGVAAGAAVMLALVAGLVVALLGLSRARESERETEAALKTTDEALTDTRVATAFLKSDLGNDAEAALWLAYAADQSRNPEQSALNKRRFIEWIRNVPVPIAATLVEDNWSLDLEFSPDSEVLRVMTFHGQAESPEKSVRLLPTSDPAPFRSLAGNKYRAVHFHPTKSQVATVDSSGTVSVYNWETENVVVSLPLLETGMAALAYSPDGTQLAVAGVPRGGDGTFMAAVVSTADWDAAPHWEPLDDFPRYLEWNLDGHYLVAGVGGNHVRFFASRGHLETTHDEPIPTLSLRINSMFTHMLRPQFPKSDSHAVLLILASDASFGEFDLSSGELTRHHHKPYRNPPRSWALAPDLESPSPAEELYVSLGPSILPVTRPDKGLSAERKAEQYVLSMDVSPDGARLVAGIHGGAVSTWSLENSILSEGPGLSSHPVGVKGVAFSPDGLLLATVERDGLLRVWRNVNGGETPDFYFPVGWTSSKNQGARSALIWNNRWGGWDPADGGNMSRWVPTDNLVNCNTTVMAPIPHNWWFHALISIATWSVGDGALLARGFSTGQRIMGGAFSPTDPALLVTLHLADRGGCLIRWNAHTGKQIGPAISLPAPPRDVAFSADGRRLAVVCDSNELLTIDLGGSKVVASQIQEAIAYQENNDVKQNGEVDFSPDGKLILSWGVGTVVRAWDSESEEVLYTVDLGSPVMRVHHTPDGLSCSGTERGKLCWWHTKDGTPAEVPAINHPETIRDLEFSADYRDLVISCTDGSVGVWDWRSGSLRSVFDLGDEVYSSVVTKEGHIVSGGVNKALRLWDPRTGKPLGPPLHCGEVRSINLVRSGNRELVLAGVAEGGVFGFDLNQWRNHQALSFSQCFMLGEVIAGVTITESGSSLRLTEEQWIEKWNRLDEEQLTFLQGSYSNNPTARHRLMSDRPAAKPIRDWHREQLRRLDPKVAGGPGFGRSTTRGGRERGGTARQSPADHGGSGRLRDQAPMDGSPGTYREGFGLARRSGHSRRLGELRDCARSPRRL